MFIASVGRAALGNFPDELYYQTQQILFLGMFFYMSVDGRYKRKVHANYVPNNRYLMIFWNPQHILAYVLFF